MVYSKESTYFVLAVIFSIIIYPFFILLFGIYVLPLMLVLFVSHGLMIGNIRGNAIKVTPNQFPELYDKTLKYSSKLNLKKIPNVYILQGNGILNAMATHFFRNFVIIYSDVYELAYQEGEEAVDFILCHELAHLKRNHIEKNYWLFPGLLVPFLRDAYSRACEYTCDRMSASLVPNGAVKGLLILTAGKKLYNRVNIKDFIYTAQMERGFWSWLAEIFSTHPHLYKRIKEVNMLKQVFIKD